MSSKKLGVLALVAVLVIGALVIGVLVIVGPQDDPPAPAEEAPPAPEVAEAPPAEEAPPAPIAGPGEIVPPAGFTAVLTRDVEGAIMTQYIGSGTAEDAFAAFKTSVRDAGWTPTLEGEAPVVPIAEAEIPPGAIAAGFERGDEVLGMLVMQAEDQIAVTVVIIPKEVLEAIEKEVIPAEEEEVPPPPEEVGPPTSDVAGEDISDVPRYPGSVRTGSLRTKWAMSVEYISSASLDEVLAFYEKELPTYGWTDTSGRLQIDEATIAIGFEKGDRQLMIQASRSEDYSEWGPNYTSVFIFEPIP